MLEIVQHASFRIDSFELLSKCNKHGRAEQFKIIWNREGQEVIIPEACPTTQVILLQVNTKIVITLTEMFTTWFYLSLTPENVYFTTSVKNHFTYS